MENKTLISVVTVSYNAISTIEQTILSVISQTYPDIEYIIIDGGSTDGTVDIIKKYADRIAYWVSEPDKGIYDAMNKGIDKATGEWINFMNCGDGFVADHTLYDVFKYSYDDSDVIFGNSFIEDEGICIELPVQKPISKLRYYPIYRHGASFVRTVVHRKHSFNLSKRYLGYALDFECIHKLYLSGFRFRKIDQYILRFPLEGISNHPLKNVYYDFLIGLDGSKTLYLYYIFIRRALGIIFKSLFVNIFGR